MTPNRVEVAAGSLNSEGQGQGAAMASPAVTWTDQHFAETEGVVAVFDFDYRGVIAFDWQKQQAQWLLCPPFALLSGVCCTPCFAFKNIVWTTEAMHVAVHQDGIKFVNDKRQSQWGLACCDQGKNSKTVPFDKLTDCDVQEPAGTAVCCFVPNVLSTVTVDTASSGGAGPDGQVQHELSLRGLKDPHGFKKCVWDCKRGAVNLRGGIPDGQVIDRGSVGGGIGAMMGGGGGGGGGAALELAPLLMEIRDELKLHTEILRGQGGK